MATFTYVGNCSSHYSQVLTSAIGLFYTPGSCVGSSVAVMPVMTSHAAAYRPSAVCLLLPCGSCCSCCISCHSTDTSSVTRLTAHSSARKHFRVDFTSSNSARTAPIAQTSEHKRANSCRRADVSMCATSPGSSCEIYTATYLCSSTFGFITIFSTSAAVFRPSWSWLDHRMAVFWFLLHKAN